MKTCTNCFNESLDDSNFCGHCGQRLSGFEEGSTGDRVTISNAETPTLDSIKTIVNKNTPSLLSNSKGNTSHSASSTEKDEEQEHEILHAYDDIDRENTATIIHVNDEDDEEDEDEIAPLPFPPLGGNEPVQPGATVPAQGPLTINPVPFGSAPSFPAQPAPVAAQLAPVALPIVPLTHVSPPSIQITAPLSSPHMHRHHRSPPKHPKLPVHHPPCLFVAVITLIVGSVIIGVIIIFVSRPSSTSPTPIVGLAGSPIPGQSVILYGKNFAPGESVIITIDTPLQTSTGGTSLISFPRVMNIGTTAWQLTSRTAVAPASRYTVTVGADGTFKKSFVVDRSWQLESTHLAYVYKQDGKLVRSIHFTVYANLVDARTGLLGCVNSSTSIMLGSVSEGSQKRVSKKLMLCTTGSGMVHWTVNGGQNWLQLNRSGVIQAPQSDQLTASASAVGLKPGMNTTNLLFSSKQSSAKIVFSINFIVLKKPSTGSSSPGSNSPPEAQCITVTPPLLHFSDVATGINKLYQKVTISNCGASGSWSASVSTNDGEQWLHINQSNGGILHGALQSGGFQDVTITASNANLKSGTYTGHMTFSMGSSIAAVTVELIVRQKPNQCLNASTSSLQFEGVAGQSSQVGRSIYLINCGAAGHWSSLIATDDGTGWLGINSSKHDLPAGATQQVSIDASSAQLYPGRYTGLITFVMGSSAVKVHVTFVVKPSCISTSSQLLLFKSIQQQSTGSPSNPAPQSLALMNCGVAGSWIASTSTDNGGNWLSIDTSQGHLNIGAAQNLAINVSSTQLGLGIYTGQILFAMGGSTAQVQVVLIVVPGSPPDNCLSVNTRSLHFTSVQGAGNPDPQTITINNCGDAGTWSSSVSVDNGGNWLRTDLSGGKLSGKGIQDISIIPSSVRLKVGEYTGQIALSIGSSVKYVQVTLTVQPPPPLPCIQVDPSSLTFPNTDTSSTGGGSTGNSYSSPTAQGNRVESQPLRVTNCGDDGTWSTAVSTDDGSNWLTINPTSGEQNAGAAKDVSIAADSTDLEAGTYTGTVTFTIETSTGTKDTATVDVTLTVPPPPGGDTPGCITASPSKLTFTSSWDMGNPPAQYVTLSNCGPSTSWTESDSSNGAFYFSAVSGSLDSRGTQKISIEPQTGAYNLPGTYNIPVTFTTDSGASAVIDVTLIITSPTSSTCINSDSPSLMLTLYQGNNTGQGMDYLNNCGADAGTISLGTSERASWLNIGSLAPVNGSSSYATGEGSVITANVNDTNLNPGVYKDNIDASITTKDGTKPAVIGVTLLVRSTSTSTSTIPTSPGGQPLPQVSPGSFDQSTCPQDGNGNWVCTATLSLDTSASGSVNWTGGSPDLTGVNFSPSGDTLSPGQQAAVLITVPSGDCSSGTFTFTSDGGNTTSAPWSCSSSTASPTPTDTTTPTPTDTPTSTNTITPTSTDTNTPTATDTTTPISTDTSTPGPTPTDTPTSGPTATDTPTPGPTPTDTPTPGPTASDTPTPTDTPTATATTTPGS